MLLLCVRIQTNSTEYIKANLFKYSCLTNPLCKSEWQGFQLILTFACLPGSYVPVQQHLLTNQQYN